MTLPAQNYDATGAASYIGLRIYRNPDDYNEWYIKIENSW